MSERRRVASLAENLRLGFKVMWDNKLRSGLVILGVTIGVATLMAMLAVLTGLGNKIEQDVKSSDNVVLRLAKVGLVVGEEGLKLMETRPDITPDDWRALQQLPSVRHADYQQYSQGPSSIKEIHYGSLQTNRVSVFGATTDLPHVYQLPILLGRNFTEEELSHARRVVVIGFGPLGDLFPLEDPVGRRIRIAGIQYTVVGAFDERKSLFGSLADNFVLVPFTAYRKDFASRDMDFANIDLVPREGVSLAELEQDVIALMRVRHGLRPGEPNDFDLLAQDQVQEFLDRILVPVGGALLAIAAIGFMVGGIGVMAIMLVSVTERTPEIGIRKTLGARRMDILWQFLIEAAALTGSGGLLGVLVGFGFAWLLRLAFDIPASTPLLGVLLAVVGTAGVGILCGLYPALRAAGLDPVEAIRQE